MVFGAIWYSEFKLCISSWHQKPLRGAARRYAQAKIHFGRRFAALGFMQ